MEQYINESGTGPGFRYYTTLPTDALMEVCVCWTHFFWFTSLISFVMLWKKQLLLDLTNCAMPCGNKAKQFELNWYKKCRLATVVDNCFFPRANVVSRVLLPMVLLLLVLLLSTLKSMEWFQRWKLKWVFCFYRLFLTVSKGIAIGWWCAVEAWWRRVRCEQCRIDFSCRIVWFR